MSTDISWGRTDVQIKNRRGVSNLHGGDVRFPGRQYGAHEVMWPISGVNGG